MSYAAVCIGFFIFLMAFFTLNAPVQGPAEPLFTPAPQTTSQATEFCQLSDSNAPTFRAPADNVLKQGDDDVDPSRGRLIEEPKHCGNIRHQIGEMTTYRLLRSNVPLTLNDVKKQEYLWDDSSCHFSSADKIGVNVEGIDTARFKLYYPQISGEISLDRLMSSRTRNADSSYLYFIDYGLVFLLHINPDGSFVELKGGTHEGDQESFYLADIYQDIESGRGEVPPEAFACDTTRGAQIASGQNIGPRVVIPDQEHPDTNQLQLQYFVFTSARQQTTASGPVVNGWGIHCKPAVYLYPEKKQLINVKVFPKGELSYTDPPYDKTRGWTVQAFPNGQLLTINDERLTNGYLYYESKLLDSEIEKPSKGWVVESEKVGELLNQVLPELGLNKKEQSDFMDYWLNKLPESPYYFVGLVEKGQRDYLEYLEVTPKPETSIRFSLYFEMLAQPKVVEEPEIKTPQRNGFTLVDWGGMVKLHPGTPFTCSQ